MLLETEKEKVCINKIVGQNKKEVKLEGDVIVNDVKPDVLSIISTSGIPCIYKKEVMDGKVRIDGCINTYIMYLADDENSSVRSLSTSLDFTEIIDIEGAEPDMISKQNINVKNIECKILNGRKINVSANISLDVKVYSSEDVEMICSINNNDDIQIKSSSRDINTLVGCGSTKATAKDTISIDEADDLAEIMKSDIKIINRDIKLSYNKVLVKADICVSIMYLTEDNRIKSINTNIPVMGFVDMENISDESICDVDFQISNLIIKPNASDMHSIYVDVEIEITCLAYERKTVTLIDDLYSISSDIGFSQKQITVMYGKNCLKEECSLRESINIPEIDGNKLYNVKATPIIQNSSVRNGKIIYEGEVQLELLFEVKNSVNSKNMNIPFNFEVTSDDIFEGCKVDTVIDIKQDDFVVNGGDIEANIELEFNITINRNEKLNIIDEINIEENRTNDIYSMVIYFVKQKDTLWKIAKKFKSTVSDIANVNGIEDENSLRVGQQLYIPKFIKKDIAV